MKRLLSVLALSIFALSFSSQAVFAASLRAGDYVSISEDKFDDVYVATGRAEINSNIDGDLYLAAGDAVVSGNISEDLVIAGGRVTILGNVAGDLRVLGGEVTIFGDVGDDVVVVGGELNITPESVVGGSVIAGAGVLTISGEVTESVHGGIGALTISGKIGQDVVVTVQDRLYIDHLASIGGNLEYSSLIEVEVPENVIAGKIIFNQFEDREVLSKVTKTYIVQKLLSFVSALLLMLIVVLAVPNMITTVGLRTRENVLKTFGVGVLAIIIGTIGSIILMVTIIGIPLAIIMLLLLGLAFMFSKIFVAAYIGSYVAKYDTQRKPISRTKLAAVMAVAMFLYYLVSLVPVIGWIVNAVLFTVGVGAIVLSKGEYVKVLRSKKLI